MVDHHCLFAVVVAVLRAPFGKIVAWQSFFEPTAAGLFLGQEEREMRCKIVATRPKRRPGNSSLDKKSL
jgi:hypothetical protein